MKKIFAIILLLIIISAIAFWKIFIKSEVVTDQHMLNISLNNGYLKVETAESAKYISDLDYRVTKDTVELTVKTTTVLNPFASKDISKVIKLNPEIKYVKIGDATKIIGPLSLI